VNSFTRLIQYVWPYRKRLVVSFFFAIMVAVLWGANLSVTFLVVKVLLQGETLGGYVQDQISETEKTIQDKSRVLKDLSNSIQSENPNVNSEENKTDTTLTQMDLAAAPVDLLSEHTRQQTKLNSASYSSGSRQTSSAESPKISLTPSH